MLNSIYSIFVIHNVKSNKVVTQDTFKTKKATIEI